MEKFTKELLDQDWVELMMSAKQMGLTIEEIQLYLRSSAKVKSNEGLTTDFPQTKAL